MSCAAVSRQLDVSWQYSGPSARTRVAQRRGPSGVSLSRSLALRSCNAHREHNITLATDAHYVKCIRRSYWAHDVRTTYTCTSTYLENRAPLRVRFTPSIWLRLSTSLLIINQRMTLIRRHRQALSLAYYCVRYIRARTLQSQRCDETYVAD